MSGKDRKRHRSRLQAVARTAAQFLVMKPVVWRLLKVHVHGTERVDNLEAPYILVANHSSHLDTPLIFGSLPRRLSRYLAAGAAADYFFDKWWKAAPTSLFFNAWPIERSGARSRRGIAARLLEDDVPLLIYPEGGRSRTGAMRAFKPGAAALCVSRKVPCLPVALVGAFDAMPGGQSAKPIRGAEVHVVLGTPLMPQPGEIAHQFNERVRRQIIEMHDSTARAYGMKTLAEYAHTAALEKAKSRPKKALPDPKNPANESQHSAEATQSSPIDSDESATSEPLGDPEEIIANATALDDDGVDLGEELGDPTLIGGADEAEADDEDIVDAEVVDEVDFDDRQGRSDS